LLENTKEIDEALVELQKMAATKSLGKAATGLVLNRMNDEQIWQQLAGKVTTSTSLYVNVIVGGRFAEEH
jgi:hypothetical protein